MGTYQLTSDVFAILYYKKKTQNQLFNSRVLNEETIRVMWI